MTSSEKQRISKAAYQRRPEVREKMYRWRRTPEGIAKRLEWDRAYRKRKQAERNAEKQGVLLPDQSWCPSCRMRWFMPLPPAPPVGDEDDDGWNGMPPAWSDHQLKTTAKAIKVFDRIAAECGDLWTARQFWDWYNARLGSAGERDLKREEAA